MTTQQKVRRLVSLLKDIAVNMEEAVALFGDLMKEGYDRDRLVQLAVKDGANREIVRRLLQICYAVHADELHPQLVKHLESRPSLLPKAMSLGMEEQAKLLKLTVDECAERLKRVRVQRPQTTDELAGVTRCPEGVRITANGTELVLSESAAASLAKTILSMIGEAAAA